MRRGGYQDCIPLAHRRQARHAQAITVDIPGRRSRSRDILDRRLTRCACRTDHHAHLATASGTCGWLRDRDTDTTPATRLTTWLIVDSTNAVLIVSPCR
jgi:hypothetical protein